MSSGPELRAAFNVDVDSLYVYQQIHGLNDSRTDNVVWERGVVRFAELFDELGVRATFFVVGADLERWPRARAIAEDLAAAGHEIANHTWSHPFDLTHKPAAAIGEEIDRAHQLLSDVRGTPVSGFRAPGYTMSGPVFAELHKRGYGYSSSIFPCPPYYLAKMAVLASMKVRGKQSASIVGDPRVMWAPTTPHKRGGVLEMPITVLPVIRFPFIGTSLLMMGSRGYSMARPLLRRTPLVNLEFHGIDLCDLDADGIDPALKKQPDLRVPLESKLSLLRHVISDLADHRTVDTLEAIARWL